MVCFDVKNQIIERTDKFDVVADSRNYLKARFNLSEEWIGDVTAVFGFGRQFYNVVLDEDSTCIVPFEVIKKPGFSVSLFCDGEKLVTSNVVMVDVIGSGMIEGEVPDTPVPTVWHQYMSIMKKTVESGLPYIGDNGNWFLYNVDNGEYEDTGIAARAVDGKTPVKGVDYWTEEDKAEIKTEFQPFIVNVTVNEGNIATADKNVVEIIKAYKEGRTVTAVINDNLVFPLVEISEWPYAAFNISAVDNYSATSYVVWCNAEGWFAETFELVTPDQMTDYVNKTILGGAW